MRVLGIDPGSRRTGWGVVTRGVGRYELVASGVIVTDPKAPMPVRLTAIHDALLAVVRAHAPAAVAIEAIFAHRSAASALVLGQARGVALVAAATAGAPIHEYNAMTIKRSVAGSGTADKAAMQRMVGLLLGEEVPGPHDAADAVALAITHHAHALQTAAVGRATRGLPTPPPPARPLPAGVRLGRRSRR
jgi:crossover junction endodeoxyribonuclease RuvC